MVRWRPRRNYRGGSRIYYPPSLSEQHGDRRRSKAESLAKTPWIEAGVSLVVGFLLIVFNKMDLAELVWILGAALSFSRFAYEQKLEEEVLPVKRLAAIVDLEHRLSGDRFEQILRVYLEITEAEFATVKDSIIAECLEKLTKLAQQHTSDVLLTGDYFNWLFPFLRATEPGSTIWAISMMLDIEWEESQPEDTFLELNLDAARRGVTVERIFVVSSKNILEILSNKYVKSQYNHKSKFFRPLLLEREYLDRHDPKLLSQLGDGLIGVDSRVVLVDISSPEGYRGYVTMNTGEITRLRRMYENLRVNARPMSEAVERAQRIQLANKEGSDA